MGNNEMAGNVAKALEDINAAVVNYVNAVAKSTVALWQGIDEITKNVSGLSQESFSKAMNAYTEIAAMKSSQEVLAKQAEFAKAAFDSSVSNSTKVSELAQRVAKDAMDPLAKNANEVVNSVMNKIKK
ncbi:MAG: phasin family protein [Alphaproteobacteria bacterium]|nr:phasin family protein [Alphaproteobacteria bacterium]MCL2505530.1 phasin family protein [Alphaproteobacteria bacterium]